MPPDPLQTSLHTLAAGQPFLGGIAVFAASALLFVLVAALGVLVLAGARNVTWALAARVVVAGAVAVALTWVLGHVVGDTRPYLLGHYAPLTQVARDNGFPSDHTLVAALCAGFALWLDRRFFLPFVLGTLATGLGRLAVGAHHTLDVLGSVGIAAVSLGIAAAIRFPSGWAGPVLAGRRARS